MAIIGFFIGALIAIFLIASLFGWLLGKFIKSKTWIAILANIISLVLCVAVYVALQGPLSEIDQVAAYIFAQLIWMAVWLVRARRPRPVISN